MKKIMLFIGFSFGLITCSDGNKKQLCFDSELSKDMVSVVTYRNKNPQVGSLVAYKSIDSNEEDQIFFVGQVKQEMSGESFLIQITLSGGEIIKSKNELHDIFSLSYKLQPELHMRARKTVIM